VVVYLSSLALGLLAPFVKKKEKEKLASQQNSDLEETAPYSVKESESNRK